MSNPQFDATTCDSYRFETLSC